MPRVTWFVEAEPDFKLRSDFRTQSVSSEPRQSPKMQQLQMEETRRHCQKHWQCRAALGLAQSYQAATATRGNRMYCSTFTAQPKETHRLMRTSR